MKDQGQRVREMGSEWVCRERKERKKEREKEKTKKVVKKLNR